MTNYSNKIMKNTFHYLSVSFQVFMCFTYRYMYFWGITVSFVDTWVVPFTFKRRTSGSFLIRNICIAGLYSTSTTSEISK